MLKRIRITAIPILALMLLAFVTQTASAQEAAPDESLLSAVDTVWVLICAFLVFFMQAGFGFLEAGLRPLEERRQHHGRELHGHHHATIGFVIAGFGIMFGSGNGFFGTEWFFLRGIPEVYPATTIPTLAFFFFQFAFSRRRLDHRLRSDGRAHQLPADLIYSFIAAC